MLHAAPRIRILIKLCKKNFTTILFLATEIKLVVHYLALFRLRQKY